MNRLVVLISGRGSNMQAIIEACNRSQINASVVGVISNVPTAPGLAFAQQQDIPVTVVDHSTFPDRQAFDQQLNVAIQSFNPDWVVLAGFMRILGPELVHAFEGQMINIHPSLLPKYTGLNTHARVLAAGDEVHGASVHFVTAELDAGPVIAQAEVAVKDDDTEHALQQRVLRTEHKLYVDALQLCVSGNARLVNGECYRCNSKDVPDIVDTETNRRSHS